jgi:hypothetical protein
MSETKPEREICVDPIPGPDFTIYRDQKGIHEVLLPDDLQDADGGKKHSYSGPLWIKREGVAPVYGRALACRAYANRFWSITLRCGEDSAAEDASAEWLSDNDKYDRWIQDQVKKRVPEKSKAADGQQVAAGSRPLRVGDFFGYCPQGHAWHDLPVPDAFVNQSPGGRKRVTFLNSIYTLCRSLYDILFDAGAATTAISRPSGLIVLTGATDSSKSLISRGLIFLLLEQAARVARQNRQRRSHLITYEDPVEEYYIRNPATPTTPLALKDLEKLLEALHVDYTPREKNEDATTLQAVLKDALRQTPTVLFIGETRDREDWKELLQFAGSGHLVVTTSHAGSVVEAMNGIFRDTETKTPAQRSEVARRILSIIHIRSLTVSSPTPGSSSIRALLPALWKRTPQSVNNLIADGLASILPVRDREPDVGYYGRTYFFERLTQADKMARQMNQHLYRDDALETLSQKARAWDIKGE